ncbi:MAG: alpha-amylase [Calditrichaeota bacterium]|nr:alpha-amylase [Calditrichota bacterium]MCB9369927.1 alpha-amylase [Calditrichota bacterium]
MLKFITLTIFVMLAVVACKASSDEDVTTPLDMTPPEWSRNAVIYEVNVRQFTTAGTFAAFAEHLPRLQELGVNILWFMPINPIGVENRKGSLGSYYSVKDYRAINPEFGTMDEWKNLVTQCHDMGFKVIIDWVANHTSWDNPLTVDHPDWYAHDNDGSFVPPVPDWTDVIQLNYDNDDLRAWMTESMQFWVEETNIDGFRCDVAGMVPLSFWEQAARELLPMKSLFLLMENESAEYHAAFHAGYGWELFHKSINVAAGERAVADLLTYFSTHKQNYPPDSYAMYFTSNHDENSWNGTEFEHFHSAALPFAAMIMTAPGIPLIYNGQESGFNRRLLFFEKDSIDWADNQYTDFYEKLTALKHRNPALRNGEQGADLVPVNFTGDETALCYKRERDNSRVVVIVNTSQTGLNITLNDPSVVGTYQDVLEETATTLTGTDHITLPAGAAKVLELQ